MLLNISLLAILFIVGSCIGSFMNLWIYRLEKGEDWIAGRSHCDHCGKKIDWKDNIPLLSFFLLGRKSRCCKKSLSWKHPLVELSFGALFVICYLTLGYSVIYWFIGILLLGIFYADLFYWIIPDTFLVLLAIIMIIYRFFQLQQGYLSGLEILLMFGVTLFFFLVFYLLFFFTKGKGFGFGDVKFSLVMGLILGWPSMIAGIFLSFIFGSIVGIILLVLKIKKLKQAIPFGPFLVAGTVVAMMFGKEIWAWYLGLLL